MAELPRDQAQLPAMVCFVSDEVVEKVDHVGREILPRYRRDRATASNTQPDQSNDTRTAACERSR